MSRNSPPRADCPRGAAHSPLDTTSTPPETQSCRREARSSSIPTLALPCQLELVSGKEREKTKRILWIRSNWLTNNNLSYTIDGRIAPRSGLASKHFIDTGAGVIDADYRGPVKVLLFNHADADYEIKEGDRIAQLVLERIVTPEVVEVEELEESVRGAGGFGSTGKN